MPTPPVGEITQQQLWDEALTRLLNLSTLTIKRNAELEARMAELEVELSVWKQAHSVALDVSEREAKTHNVQLASLNRQISSLESFRKHDPLILCIIDGDANLFSPSLLAQGMDGGHYAAQQLTKGIAEHLSNEGVHVFGRLSFWITIYIDKLRMLDVLRLHNPCTKENFEDFLVGFGQTSPRFSVVDVGASIDGASTKIKEYLHTYIRMPQTLRVFLGGSDDNRYVSTLTDLQNEELLGKLVLLQDYDNLSPEMKEFSVSRLSLHGVFAADRLPLETKLLKSVNTNSLVAVNGGLISPQSPLSSMPRSEASKIIDSSLPLHKQNPPPCNEYYLMSCSKGAACKYGHDYILTPEEITTLATNAKKAPCNFLKNGLSCPYGERCCWGHSCPNGRKCYHLSKGRCWFKGENMHTAP